ncbi:hypothetical protein [Oscillibacter sp.]|uniref:hypothetical protein n=1 Tax=Oscillibacter sp. TaxID=1945593 RepID=UPI0033913C6E
MEIIGISPTDFTTKDGKRIEGSTIYVTEPLDSKRGGQGKSAEKFFISTSKLSALDFKPALGQSVEVLYNKFGRIQTIRHCDDSVDFG